MRKAKRKSFDWYGMRQHFSIRKFHFGAASVLLGMSLILGAGATVISAEESTIVPPAQEVVVGEEQKATETNVTDAQAKNVTALSETEVVSEVENTAVAVQVESSPVEEVQPVLPPVVEETVTVRQAVISYTVRYIDASENVLSSESLSVEVTTSDAQARHQVLVSSNLPEGYRLVAGQATEQTVYIVEGGENLITFRLEKVEMEEKKQVTEPAASQEVAKVETVSQIVDKPAEKQEPAAAVKSLIPAETTLSDTQPLAEASKELAQPVIERTVNIPYKVVQTDVETGEEKKLGQVGYVSVTTTDEVAKTEVTVTADKLRSGYRLADGQPNVITKVVAENETNILSFAVTRKKDEKDNPLTETTTAASGNAEGTSGFRAIENATRSANTVSYVTTEWQVPDEAETAGANFDKAASDASVTATTTVVPAAYQTTLPEGREVFMVLSLDSQTDPNKATTFNKKYNKDYFFQFSIAKEGEVNKVYADLVDKRQNNKIIESVEIAQGSTGKFASLAQYEGTSGNNFNYRFEFTPDPSNSTSKNLKINNPNGGNVNTVIYDKVSPKSVGTELNIHDVLVPVRTTQETKYVVKATDKRAETTLATFIQKGALTGDSYTIAGALDFDKYELIAEDVPTVLKGDLAADYKVGAKTIQSIMTHNLVRVLEVTQKDGTQKAHIYLLNPDGTKMLTLDRKGDVTEADLTSDNFIKFFTSEEIVPGAVNTLEGSHSYTSKHQFESFKTKPYTKTNIISGETTPFTRGTQTFQEGNFFIPEHKAVSLKGKDGKPFGFGGVQMKLVNDNVKNEQHVTYYYAEKGSVIIHYVNDKGETIKRSATLVGHGATGDQYDTKNYKHFSVFTGEGDALDQYFLIGIDPATSTLRPVTEDSNELRRIVKIDSETGAVERDTLKELTYVYEKAAKALVEIYLRPVDVETGNVSGPDKLDHTIREQGRKETIIPKRITLDILQNYIDRGYEVISDGFSNKTTYYDSIEDGVGTVAPSQVYNIVLRERIKTVTPDAPKEPNTPIDPTNPTGPKYPEGVRATDLNESVKRTIKYQYEGGAEARPTVEETLTYKRTAKVNVVTGALAYTPWTSTDDDFNEVVSPTIDGYEADKPTVEAVQDVPYNAQDTEVIVTYRKDSQKATITYKDDKGTTLGNVDEVTGKSGEPINYTTTARITELTNQGYEV
ncbi:TPA: YSIRK-type signal peptide-containing protein, partial [Streptococcus suis]